MNLQAETLIFETEFKVQQALQKREGGKTEYETLVLDGRSTRILRNAGKAYLP